MDLTIVAGQTRYLDFLLKNDAATFDACGMGVSGVLRNTHGAVRVLTSSESVAWLVSTCSQVRYTPTSCDFVDGAGPYSLRFKVTDTASKINYYPSTVDFNVTVLSQ